jgi:hypothetical protein
MDAVRVDADGREVKAPSASAVYRKAARWLDSSPIGNHIMAYACLMVEPDGAAHKKRIDHLRCWLGDPYIDGGHTDDVRVLALLLMSEIAKDEQ